MSAASTKIKPQSWLRGAAKRAFYFRRWCERLVPPSVLSVLLWPAAAVWDLLQLRPRKLIDCWRRFPESWRPRRWRFFLRQSLGLYHAQLSPDHLCTSRGLSRCRLESGTDLIGLRDGDQGAVLASLHYGPYEVAPFWLRAHGIVTAMIRDAAAEPSDSLTSYRYAFSPPVDVPVFLSVDELAPLPRFAHVRTILGPGRRLLVMVDVDRGMQLQVPFEGRWFRMATGAIRLAAMADADLIPCLIRETTTWKFSIHFGEPVPRDYFGSSPDLQAIGRHLLNEFSKVITRYPEQCRSTLLSAISPRPVNGVRDSLSGN
jgi:hypothetical protein